MAEVTREQSPHVQPCPCAWCKVERDNQEEAMSEPTQQQKCEDLARAIFPAAVIEPSSSGNGVDIRIYDKPNETRSWDNFDPYENPADCHALVVWLAKQGDKFWGVFSGHLLDATMPFELQEYGNFEDVTLAVLTADPAIKAEAAWQAIKEK